MAIVFPASPSVGQKFDSGTARYVWNGTVWDTKPLGTALPFNYLTNGSFQVSQQNGDNISSVSGYYPADEWVVSLSGISTNLQRQGSRTLAGSQYKLHMPVNAPSVKPTLGTSDYYLIGTGMEGNRVAQFAWGTPNAKQAILRFWVYNSTATGIYGGGIRNPAGDRSYAFQYTVTSTQAEYQIVIPGDTGGTWVTDNSKHAINLYFCFGCGWTAIMGTPGSWQNANLLAPTSQANGFSAGNTFQLSDVGFYMDPDLTGRAPPHVIVPEQTAHMDAMRHWHKSQGGRGVSTGGASVGRMMTQHTVQPRIAPALAIVGPPTVYDQGTNPALTGITSVSSLHNNEFDGTLASAGVGGRAAIQDVAVANTLYVASNAR